GPSCQGHDPSLRCGEAGAPSPLRFGADESGASIDRRTRRLIGAPRAPPPPRCAIRPRAPAARLRPRASAARDCECAQPPQGEGRAHESSSCGVRLTAAADRRCRCSCRPPGPPRRELATELERRAIHRRLSCASAPVSLRAETVFGPSVDTAGQGDVAARGSMYFQFANVLVFFALAFVLCGLMLGLGILLRPANPSRSKL